MYGKSASLDESLPRPSPRRRARGASTPVRMDLRTPGARNLLFPAPRPHLPQPTLQEAYDGRVWQVAGASADGDGIGSGRQRWRRWHGGHVLRLPW